MGLSVHCDPKSYSVCLPEGKQTHNAGKWANPLKHPSHMEQIWAASRKAARTAGASTPDLKPPTEGPLTFWWLVTSSRVLPSSSASLTFSFCSAESCWDFWAAACFRVSLQGQWAQGYHRNKTSKETVGDNSFTALRKIDLGHMPDKIYNNKRLRYLHEGEVTF